MKIKTNDLVLVKKGKDRGKTGKVVLVDCKTKRAIVEGINKAKKHLKARGEIKGGIIELERPLYCANLAVICPVCEKTTRVGYKLTTDGKERICKKCNESLDKKVEAQKTRK